MNIFVINSNSGEYVADVSKFSETINNQYQIETVNIIDEDTLEFSTKNIVYLSKVDDPPIDNVEKYWNEESDIIIYELKDIEPPF